MRVSDAHRELALSALRARYVEGYLGTDTFEARAATALRARTAAELDAVVHDLPRRPAWSARLQVWLARYVPRRLPRAALPRASMAVVFPPPCEKTFTIGRSPDCDLVLDDDTVSRRHARLDCRDGGWFIRDLRSTNGVRVNGWRINDAPVREGDQITLGAVSFSLRRPQRDGD